MKTFLTPLVLVLISVPSWAHINSFSYMDMTVTEKEIRVDLKLTQRTTLELFALDVNYNASLEQEELDAAWEVLYYYLDNKFKVLRAPADGNPHGFRQLKPEITKISYLTDQFDAYVRIECRFQLDAPVGGLHIFNNLSEETDPYHRSLTRLTTPAGEFRFAFTRYNFLQINSDGTNNGIEAEKKDPLSEMPVLPGAPETIRSVTGSAVIDYVSPTAEGWARAPETPQREGATPGPPPQQR